MAWQHTLKARWAALAPREQRSLTLAAWVVLLAVVWGLLLAPALRTLKSVEAQRTALNAELERMQALQLRATQLQAKPAVAPQDSVKALQAAVAALGTSARLQLLGEQATLTLTQVDAQSLAQWLSPKTSAGIAPAEAQLQRDTGTTKALWSGTLVFRLPAAVTTTP